MEKDLFFETVMDLYTTVTQEWKAQKAQTKQLY